MIYDTMHTMHAVLAFWAGNGDLQRQVDLCIHVE